MKTIETIILLFVLNLFYTYAYCKNNDSTIQALKKPVCIVKLDPLAWVGIEAPFNERLNSDLDIGYIFYGGNLDRSRLNFKVRAGLRRYVKKESLHSRGWYIGPEISFRMTHYALNQEVTDGWAKTSNALFDVYEPINPRNNNYQVTKNDLRINAKLGYQRIFDSNISLDIFSVLGVKHIESNTKGKQFSPPDPNGSWIGWSSPDFGHDPESNGDFLNIEFGFRIGYAFGRNK